MQLLAAGFFLMSTIPTLAQSERTEIDLIKSRLAAQEEQIVQLHRRLEEQSKLIERVLQTHSNTTGHSNGNIDPRSSGVERKVSSVPMVPAVDQNAAAKSSNGSSQVVADTATPSPLSFRIGATSLTPIGFMDFTAVMRDKNVGSGIGTNFGAIPFNNTVFGHLRDYRFSAQNSRLGMRLDTSLKGLKVLGYLETDFMGILPGNVAVSSNSDTQRLRLFWVDMRKEKTEFLAGQSWSMLTPNRKGLSPLPADIFLTQVIDPNYHVGLVWSRNPQVRLVYHANETVTLGLSLEAAEQYAGGSSGSGTITLPAELVPSYLQQLNTGNSFFTVPNPHQDLIAKVAFDPKVRDRSMHFEVAGLLTRLAFFNPLSNRSFKSAGGGGSVNFNIELVKKLQLYVNTFYNDGGGQFVFGLGPELIIQGDGSPSLVHSASTVNGLEYQATPQTRLYGYYGGAYFQKNVAIDPSNGRPVGFGYPGSPSNHNRSIQEASIGFTHTFWRDPNYGAMQLMMQYSYLVRHPWYVAPGQPGSAHLNMFYLNLRYTLPGAPPGQK